MSGRSGRAGWRPALRIAWRDARRARARTALVLLMVALPVAGVVAADVVRATQEIRGTEALERRLGGADARVTASANGPVLQAPDPDAGMAWGIDPSTGAFDQAPADGEPASAADLRAILGAGSRVVPVVEGSVRFRTDRGVADATTVELDLRDPLAEGLFELTGGRLPEAGDEVVVNGALAERGPGIGGDLELADGRTREVVGSVESSSTTGYAIAVGLPGSLDGGWPGAGRTWLVDAGPVTWTQVRALNHIGASVVSRAVLEDPPPLPPEAEELLATSQVDDAVRAVAVLVVVMALLEVVLLAGPAFAVSARRHARTLALLAASGGTPRQARRVVLASGLVLGGVAALVGSVVGVVAGWALLPVLQRFSDQRFGPFDVPWTHVPLIAGLGLLSAVLAAVVPAVLASRQDPVAVLAGRRGDRRPSARTPVLGLVLVGAGIAGAAYGATRTQQGEVYIATAALLCVLGMVLLVPVVVATLAVLSRRLPLALRYAVRDAARHRTRTGPAVAAVAATVAGVVALGIAVQSDEAQNEAGYQPQLPMGWGIARGAQIDPEAWAGAARQALPGAQVAVVRGLVEDDPDAGTYTSLVVADEAVLADGYTSALGSSWLVAEALPAPLAAALELPPSQRREATRTLGAGGAVLLTGAALPGGEVRLRVEESDHDTGEPVGRRAAMLPATAVDPGPGDVPPAAGVLSPAAARELGLRVGPRSVVVSGVEITEAAAQDVGEVVAGSGPDSDFYVERGYQSDDETVVVQLVLAGLGAVLMLGGTLTATFLALADARPDLATLAAVGASPRRRRGVAAAYALVVGGTGAVLGALVGFVPGVAISFPLTRDLSGPLAVPSHHLDVPWLMITGLVVGLPLLVAGVVWVSARSRLPLAARQE